MTRRDDRTDAMPTHAGATGRLRVGDVMTTTVVAVDKRTLGTQITRLMSQHRIHAIPVLSGGGKVIGVVAEADLRRSQQRERQRTLARLVGRTSFAAGAGSFTADRLMTSPAITVSAAAPIGAAARHMTSHHVSMLPVVDSSGRLVGVVAQRDLLLAVAAGAPAG